MSLPKFIFMTMVVLLLSAITQGYVYAANQVIALSAHDEDVDAFLSRYRDGHYSLKEAEHEIERILSALPSHKAVLRARMSSLLVQIYIARGRVNEAKSIYESYLSVGLSVVPPEARVRMLSSMLEVYWRLDDGEKYTQTQQMMLETLREDDARDISEISTIMRASASIKLSQSFLGQNDYAKGLEFLYHGRHLLVSSEDIASSVKNRLMQVVQRDLVTLLQELGTFDIAASFAEEDIKDIDNLPLAEKVEAHYFWAYRLMMTGRFGEANKHFEQAVDLSLSRNDMARAAEYMNLMSVSLFLDGDYERSLDILVKFMKFHQGDEDGPVYRLHQMVFESLVDVMELDDSFKVRFPDVNIDTETQSAWWALERDDVFMLQVNAQHASRFGSQLDKVESMSALYQYYSEDYQSKINGTSYKKLIEDDAKINVLLSQQLQKRVDLKNKLLAEKDRQTSYAIVITVAGVIGVALLTFLLIREVRTKKNYGDMAMTDPLTSAPNRRAITQYAEEVVGQACARNPNAEGACIALIDLDHFKSINDTYGHDVGDEVLKLFCNTCHPLLRSGDKLGRYGGEEFLLVLPDATKEDVKQVFFRLQSALKEAKVIVGGKELPIKVTMSMGATIYSHARQSKNADLFDVLMRTADEHVYKAKSSGRDCLVIC